VNHIWIETRSCSDSTHDPAGANESIQAPKAKLKLRALRIFAWAATTSAFLVLAAPLDANAHIGKCTMGSLTPAEQSLLLATVAQHLPADSVPVVSNLCGSKSAEVTTQKNL
jgi:hypothetical protein